MVPNAVFEASPTAPNMFDDDDGGAGTLGTSLQVECDWQYAMSAVPASFTDDLHKSGPPSLS